MLLLRNLPTSNMCNLPAHGDKMTSQLPAFRSQCNALQAATGFAYAHVLAKTALQWRTARNPAYCTG